NLHAVHDRQRGNRYGSDLLVLVDVHGEAKIVRGQRHAVVPGDPGPEAPGDLHPTVREHLPGAVLDAGQGFNEPGMADVVRVDVAQTPVEDRVQLGHSPHTARARGGIRYLVMQASRLAEDRGDDLLSGGGGLAAGLGGGW